jgi:hypothetical protein
MTNTAAATRTPRTPAVGHSAGGVGAPGRVSGVLGVAVVAARAWFLVALLVYALAATILRDDHTHYSEEAS